MTDHPKAALENGMAMEAKKHGMGQHQNGQWTVTFNVHPNDMPIDLMTARMGTRFALTLFEVLDNEELKPVSQEAGTGQKAHKTADTQPTKDDRAPSKSHAQMAGMLCNDPSFCAFMYKMSPHRRRVPVEVLVRDHCGVDSRAEFDTSKVAANSWVELKLEFEAWKIAPGCGA